MEDLSDMQSDGRKACILRYVGLASKALIEKDPDKLQNIAQERAELEHALSMTSDEIVLEAKRIIVPE